MKSKALFVVLILGISLGLTLLWVLGAQASVSVSTAPESEIHVCPGGDCLYDNLQEAVDGANEGDIIKVAEGTYTGVSGREGVTQTVYINKTLTIQGGYTKSNWVTPNPELHITTLDAQGLGRVLYITGQIAPTIAGFHITGGNALGLEPGEDGGGIYMGADSDWNEALPTLKENTIFGNTARDGGGIYHASWDTLISGNSIYSNTAEVSGGGMAIGGASQIANNLFAGNSASLGGGLAVLWGDVILQGNTFTGNYAGEAGGGLFAYDSNVESNADTFISNSTQRGGGLAIIRDPYQQTWRYNFVVNTLVANNQASVEGTGIYITGIQLHLWHTTVTHNTGGDGSGIAIGNFNPWSEAATSTLDLRNTIVASQSIGLNVKDASTVDIDSILWFETPIAIAQVPEADVTVVNDITDDPAFVDPNNGDYHITGASAARDVGMVTGVPTDLDGLVRPMGFGYDLGAYEYSEAALSLLKTPSLSGANVGKDLIYTIVLTSSGTQDTSNVVLTDTLDAWQRATAVESPEGNCTITDPTWGGTVVCSPGDLNIGDVIIIALTAEVDASARLGQAMTNTLTARADEAANSTQAVLYAQDCHVRIGDNAKEYSSVQAAVDEAYPTALVKVAGTCMGVYGPEGWRQQVYVDKSVTIQGGYTVSNWTTPDPEANITTLDASGQGRVFYMRGNGNLNRITIDGLYITGGNAYGQVGDHSPIDRYGSSGGGVYLYGGGDQFTFSNNHIFNNQANGGGGMTSSFSGGLQLIGDTFTANRALGGGGGFYLHAGGGMFTDVVFDSNIAGGGNGGGMDVVMGNAVIVRGTFVNNHASRSGGAMMAELGWFISESLILSNTAERGGGVAYYENGNPWSSHSTFTNTVIADNQASLEGAGMFIPSGQTVRMLQVTLARNGGGDGSGVTLGWYDWQSQGASSLVMTNTILAYQEVGIRVLDGSELMVNGVLWHADTLTVTQSTSATVWVQNQHSGDPDFLDPDNGDYHIGEASAARDMGINSGVTWDLDGETRPMGYVWDLGADEYLDFLYRLFLPLVLRR